MNKETLRRQTTISNLVMLGINMNIVLSKDAPHLTTKELQVSYLKIKELLDKHDKQVEQEIN